jgi:hypothetical protein
MVMFWPVKTFHSKLTALKAACCSRNGSIEGNGPKFHRDPGHAADRVKPPGGKV